MNRILCCRKARQQSCRLRLQSAANSEQTEKKATRQRRKPKESTTPSTASPNGRRRPKKAEGEKGPSTQRPTDAKGEVPRDQTSSEEPVLSEEMSSAQESSQEGAEEVFEGWTPGNHQAVKCLIACGSRYGWLLPG